MTAMFLVDPGCLGLKQGFVSQFQTRAEYETGFRTMIMARKPMVSVSFSLTVKIIRETMHYARGLGFEPSQEARNALKIVGPLDKAGDCEEEIPPGGKNGKPCYRAGMDDDVDRIMNTLIRKCGHGNFGFIAPGGPIPPGFFD